MITLSSGCTSTSPKANTNQLKKVHAVHVHANGIPIKNAYHYRKYEGWNKTDVGQEVATKKADNHHHDSEN